MIEKVLAGTAIFIITSLIAYAFKARQLYALVPKLHRKSFLSDGGSVAELTIYNKGTKVEEDVSLEIRQELKCELLASNNSNTHVDKSVVKVDRIHAHSEISLILLVENGTLSYDDLVSLSSKEKKGSFIKKIDDLPPAASTSALSVSALIIVLSIFYWGGGLYNYLESKYIQYGYPELSDSGWQSLGRYITSDLSESYSNQEFPLRLIKVTVKNKEISLNYEVINKSSIPIEVFLMDLNKFENEGKNDLPFKSVKVEPLEKKNISIKFPNTKQEVIVLRCSIDFGDEYIHGIENKVILKKYNKAIKKDI